MKQLTNYKEINFKQDYFHYAGNNNYFIDATLKRESPEFSMENNRMKSSLNVSFETAVAKLGSPNWINQEYYWVSYWIFEFNGDTFYYMNDTPNKGSTIGIYCKKKDTSRNWLFEPEEYDYQDSEYLGKKLLAFCKELSEKLK